MANVNVTSDAWTEISITSGTIQNISATADIELSAEQTDNSGVVLKPSEIYQWDNETIYARAVTEETGALRVVNFKKATGGGSSVAYSTSEQRIGTWIDGKPLYQITIVDTMPTVITDGTRVSKNIDVSFLCINKVIRIDGSVQSTNGWEVLNSINTIDTSINFSAFRYCGYSSNSLFLATSWMPEKDAPVYISLQYTKTTDERGAAQ